MRWIVDEEGDIGLTFWGILTLIKYKEHIIWRWFGSKLADAPRYVEDGAKISKIRNELEDERRQNWNWRMRSQS